MAYRSRFRALNVPKSRLFSCESDVFLKETYVDPKGEAELPAWGRGLEGSYLRLIDICITQL